MSASNGEITIAPYRGSTTLEADVKMLVEAQEVRRRWKSPHGSRTSTERWAREKAGERARAEARRAPSVSWMNRAGVPTAIVVRGPLP